MALAPKHGPRGFANFSYAIPYDHPLGLIVVQMVFNGSVDLLSTSANPDQHYRPFADVFDR